MSAKYSFRLTSEIKSHALPAKILIGQHPSETTEHVLLKLLARVIFSRERLQLEPRLHDENIPFVPSLIQLDYELRPVLWVEVGDCPTAKLDKLAVKANEAEIWVVLGSDSAAEEKHADMIRYRLRKGRYQIAAFGEELLSEMRALLEPTNTFVLFHLNHRGREIQFEFNDLWFDVNWTVRTV